MVTPFDADGRVELGAAQKLAAWLLDNGSEGLVVTGTTGEGPTLTDREKVDLWRAPAEAVGPPPRGVARRAATAPPHSLHLTPPATHAPCPPAPVLSPHT